MPDDRLNDDPRNVGSTPGDGTGVPPGTDAGAETEDFGQSAHDLSALFAHGQDEDPAGIPRDEVGALFAAPPARAGDAGFTGELHALFGGPPAAADGEHSATPTRPIPVNAGIQPQHAAPTYSMTRTQRIAMGIGAIVTLLGAGWALATPAVSIPVAVESPTPTVDSARITRVNDTVDALATAVTAAQASAASFAAPLAAMAGSSEEANRVAAETARQAYIAAIAAVKVPEHAGTTASTKTLDQREQDVASAQSSLATATTGFRSAITTFRQSIPAFAATAVANNPDAAESVRTAATDAATAAAAADPFGPTPFAALDAWRAALAALIADQARAIAEQNASNSGGSDGGTPAPSPEPTPPDTTTPTPPPPATDPTPTPTDPPVIVIPPPPTP